MTRNKIATAIRMLVMTLAAVALFGGLAFGQTQALPFGQEIQLGQGITAKLVPYWAANYSKQAVTVEIKGSAARLLLVTAKLRELATGREYEREGLLEPGAGPGPVQSVQLGASGYGPIAVVGLAVEELHSGGVRRAGQ